MPKQSLKIPRPKPPKEESIEGASVARKEQTRMDAERKGEDTVLCNLSLRKEETKDAETRSSEGKIACRYRRAISSHCNFVLFVASAP